MKAFVPKDLEDLALEFIQDKLNELDKISTLLKEQEFKKVSIYGHNLAGNAPSFGLKKLGEIGEQIEIEALNSNSLKINTLLNEIENYLLAVELITAEDTSVGH